jgi:hypothetical protein
MEKILIESKKKTETEKWHILNIIQSLVNWAILVVNVKSI